MRAKSDLGTDSSKKRKSESLENGNPNKYRVTGDLREQANYVNNIRSFFSNGNRGSIAAQYGVDRDEEHNGNPYKPVSGSH